MDSVALVKIIPHEVFDGPHGLLGIFPSRLDADLTPFCGSQGQHADNAPSVHHLTVPGKLDLRRESVDGLNQHGSGTGMETVFVCDFEVLDDLSHPPIYRCLCV